MAVRHKCLPVRPAENIDKFIGVSDPLVERGLAQVFYQTSRLETIEAHVQTCRGGLGRFAIRVGRAARNDRTEELDDKPPSQFLELLGIDRRAESHEAAWAHSMYARIANADSRDGAGFDTVIDDAMSALESERDRRVLSLWLMGMNHNEIASEMGANPAAVRQQWCRMRQRLASALGAELEDAARSKSGASNAA